MAEDFVQVPPDSTGKKIRNEKVTIGPNDVEQQVVTLAKSDGTLLDSGIAVTNLPADQLVHAANLDAAVSTLAKAATQTDGTQKSQVTNFPATQPVSEIDGADVTQGAKADAAVTDSTTSNTLMSFIKGMVKILADVWDSAGHTVKVSGTFWQATQPVSATSLPLPTGAATETTLTEIGADIDVIEANLDVALSTRSTEATLDTRLADATFTGRINTLGQKSMANSTPVALASDQSAIPVTANPTSVWQRTDTYVAAANGVAVNAAANPPKSFAIQVTGTGGVAVAWDVRLEASLDGVNWTTVLQHTTAIGDGIVVWSGAVLSPSLQFRSRCAGLTLGAGSNIVVAILGV